MIAAKTAGERQQRTNNVPLKRAAQKITLPAGGLEQVAEIRLRTNRPAYAVTLDGRNIPCSPPFSQEDISECFLELCRNSVHSFAREIAEGYITLPGGGRVGFCGTAVIQEGRLTALRDISSLNIRFPRQVRGCAELLCRRAFAEGLCSLIVCGKPLSGKTTVLRDMARILGQEHRVAVVDSRGELAGVHGGVPALDVGENTDVLNGYSKSDGIMCALRSLSPEIIICDEIGDDAEAVRQCMNCGVKLAVSAHAGSIRELKCRPALAGLLPLFDKAALLGELGRLSEIAELSERAL